MEQAGFDFDGPSDGAAAPGAAPDGGPAEEPTLTVGELTTHLHHAVRRAFPTQLWVRGEVQNLSRSAVGHVYFTLVEKAVRGDRVQSRLDCVLFRDDRRSVEQELAAVPGAELADDVEVRVRGRVTVYAPQGRLQLQMVAIDPVFTVGGIAANRERVLRALAADGVLDANARLALPPVPLRIGLVTSVGSAAYHDFVHELERSGFAWQVCVVDVRVQGNAASRRIVWGLRGLAARRLDAVVIVRGGGSRADLGPFDTEIVARAVAAMPVPVITGIGHETDRSVVDEVAHLACKTPTACAQHLVAAVQRFVHGLDERAGRVISLSRRRQALAANTLAEAERRAHRLAPRALLGARVQLDRRRVRVDELGRRTVRDADARLVAHQHRVVRSANHRLQQADLHLASTERGVRALDPRRVLERGYSVTRDRAGRVVREIVGLAPGEEITTQLAAGTLRSTVTDVEDVVDRHEEAAGRR